MPTADELGVPDVRELVENVLQLEGRVQGDEYNITCPNPGHADSSPSCDVNLETGLWNCFSCGAKGDLVRLYHLVTGVPMEQAVERLRSGNPLDVLRSMGSRLAKMRFRPIPPGSRRPKLPDFNSYQSAWARRDKLRELRARGFNDATLSAFGVQWVEEQELHNREGKPFNLTNSWGIPVVDTDNLLMAWCYRRSRWSGDWQPKYLYSDGVEVADLWFGLQFHAEAREIAIVEGAFDAMWFHQCGVPALALLGAEMGQRKIMWLQRYRSVTLVGDFDVAGHRWVERVGDMLGGRMPVRVARYASWMNSDDPQELAPVDVEIIVERAVPWQRYLLDRAAKKGVRPQAS